jgi:methionyl-tRNA formyltransferase
MALRLVFMGTPQFSVPTLSGLIEAGHDVAAVYSQPPRPAGRGYAPTKSPVHASAEARGIPVLTPVSLTSPDAQAALAAHGADAAVVVAYGLLLPKPVLDAPRYGCFNLHASKLPRWRGAAPIQRAIMAGDTETASMVMHMDAGLDTGPVCAASPMAIGPEMTAGELHDALSVDGARLMRAAIADLERGQLQETPQPAEGVTYAAKIDKAEARIDFSWPAGRVHDLIRGLSPSPGAWFEAGPEGKRERVKVLRATVVAVDGRPGAVLDDDGTVACGSGAIRLVEVQRAGKRPQAVSEFLRGFALAPGAVVGSGDR